MDLKAFSNSLMPEPQKTRSYGNTQEITNDITINFIRLGFGENKKKKHWTVQFTPSFPIGSFGHKLDPSIIQKKAKDYLEFNSYPQDLAYITIIRADSMLIEYQFEHEKWFQDNFAFNPSFRVPATLRWHYKKMFPLFIYSNQAGMDLKHYIEARFCEWVNVRYLKNPKFKFIEKIIPTMFDFKWDYVVQTMVATLKYSVILGSLALYMAIYGKDSSKTDINKIKRDVANFGSISKLDNYLRRLK